MTIITKSTYLRGPQGTTGLRGERGVQGVPGPQGNRGATGSDADFPSTDSLDEGIENLYHTANRVQSVLTDVLPDIGMDGGTY